MVSRFELLIQYLIVIVSLPSRECNFPIQIRQGCRKHIGTFPLGVHPDGFLCFMSDFFGVQHHRDLEHAFTFSKLRKDLQTRIWDPGVPNFKTDNCGLRPWTSHIYGNLFVFVTGIGIFVLSRLKTSMILYTDVGILFNLLFNSSGTREMLLKFKTRVINFRLENMITLPQSDQIFVYVHVQIGSSGFAMSRLHVGPVNYWLHVLIDITHICWLRKALEMYRWESIDASESETWIGTVHLHDYVEENYRVAVFQTALAKSCCIQRRYHDGHRDSLRDLSSTLISVRRQVPEFFPTTFIFIPLKKVMPRAFWSLSYKLLSQ